MASVDEIEAPPKQRLVYDGRILHVYTTAAGVEVEHTFDAALCQWSRKEAKWGRKKGGIHVSIWGGRKGGAAFFVDAQHADAVTAWLDRYVGRAGTVRPAEASESPTAGTNADSSDLSEQLAKIADLHAQGVLSDDEFAHAKAKLLDPD